MTTYKRTGAGGTPFASLSLLYFVCFESALVDFLLVLVSPHLIRWWNVLPA
jgi:hypothetical protein